MQLNDGKMYGAYKNLNRHHPEFPVNTVRLLLADKSNYPNPIPKLTELLAKLGEPVRIAD